MKSLTTNLIVASFSIALAGCVTAKGGVTTSALPPLKPYSASFQKGLKAELQACRPNCPNTTTAVKDYGVLRDQIRAGKAVHEKHQKKASGGLFGFGLLK